MFGGAFLHKIPSGFALLLAFYGYKHTFPSGI